MQSFAKVFIRHRYVLFIKQIIKSCRSCRPEEASQDKFMIIFDQLLVRNRAIDNIEYSAIQRVVVYNETYDVERVVSHRLDYTSLPRWIRSLQMRYDRLRFRFKVASTDARTGLVRS